MPTHKVGREKIRNEINPHRLSRQLLRPRKPSVLCAKFLKHHLNSLAVMWH